MNHLGKNLVLTLCVVVMLLVILGLKRRFDADGKAALLSQPSEDTKITRPEPARNSPRPRVLQAKPVTQNDRAILSPTNSQYTEWQTDPSHARGVSIAPIPNPVPSPRPLDAPELVPIDGTSSAETIGVGDEVPEAMPVIETPTVPVSMRPLPEFVLTDAEDSFWSISERVYGSGVYYRALFRHNEAKVLRPDQLRAGVEVRTPSLEVLQKLYPNDFPNGPALTP